MMDLLDRYLAAVRRNLPAAKADDIVAELRDDLMTRQEEREESLGRPLTSDETSALLKDFGHPLTVASRYRKHQYLIGPEAFPFYLATMRVVLLIVGAVVIVISIAKALLGGVDPIQAIAQTLSGLWSAVFINVAIVTAVFAILERRGFPFDHLRKWVPEDLPALSQKQPGPWESAFEVAASIGFLLWWTGAIVIPYTAQAHDFRLDPDPIWGPLFWPVLVLAAARLVHNVILWLRPRWTVLRHAIGAATAVGGVALLLIIFQAGHWVTVVSTGMPAAQALQLDESLNLALRIAMIVTGVIWTLGCMGALWQMIRAWRERA
jgi:hypothetical protein